MDEEAVGTEAAEDSGIRFEIDLESEATPDEASPQGAGQQQAAEPSSQSSVATPVAAPSWEDRYQNLERDFQFLQSQISPLLQHQQQQLIAQNRPPRTLDEIQNDPNATAKDLVEYVNWLNDQRLAQIRSETEIAATRAASSQRARGLLTAEALGGPGRDYDSLVSRHVAPLIRQNPWVRQALQAASPQDPALGEYIFGAVSEIASRNNGDIVKTMRSIWNALDAEQRGAQEVASRIGDAQRQLAQRVVPGSRPGTTQTRRLSANEISSMSEADFDRLDRQISGGW